MPIHRTLARAASRLWGRTVNPIYHDPTFREWLRLLTSTPEYLANYDRLRGTNIARRGPFLALQIDDATGRFEAESRDFLAHAVDLFERLPA